MAGEKPSLPAQFKIKKIDIEALRRALKRMKVKKPHRVDNIESYSLKMVVHLWKMHSYN